MIKDIKYLMREILTSKKLMVIYLKTGEGKNLSPEKKSELNLHIYFLDTMVSAIGKNLDAAENASFYNNPEVEKANKPEKQSLQAETIFYSSVSHTDVDLDPYSDFYTYVTLVAPTVATIFVLSVVGFVIIVLYFQGPNGSGGGGGGTRVLEHVCL
jgi:hypothetical protein